MTSPEATSHKKKAGMAVLVGRSNVGKSTLINALVGTKVAITSPKPQTTRHSVHGVVTTTAGQAVLVDTPGIFARIPDRLTAKLNDAVEESLKGIDVVVYVVDPTRRVGDEEEKVHRMVRAARAPKILVLNKSDLEPKALEEYAAWQDEFDKVLQVSALEGKNVRALGNAIMELLPEGDPLYPEGQFTDRDAKFRLAEIIREKVFLALHDEIPYSVTVDVDELETRDNGVLYVHATILTNAQRYRKMLIGAGGRTVKRIGQSVRKELEVVTGGKAFVDLEVDVDERWQERF